MNAVRAVSGCRARTRGIEAALRDLIAQGSRCIAQPHGQRRTAVTAERMISPYVQNASSAPLPSVFGRALGPPRRVYAIRV